MPLETMRNTGKQTPKIQWQVARGRCRSHLNYKLFSENFSQGKSSVTHWEISVSGYCDKISTGTNNNKISKKL